MRVAVFAVSAAMCFLGGGCVSAYRYFFPTERMAVASPGAPSRPAVRLGHFEYRDQDYNPFTESNFRDMLEFHLLARGFEATSLQDEAFGTLDRGPMRQPPAAKSGADSTQDLLPPSMKGVAGETAPADVQSRNVRRVLYPREVQILATALRFDYLLQGSVARSESGPLLEREESVLIMIHIVDSQGLRQGAVSYSIRGEELQDMHYMRRLCEKLAEAVAGKLTGARRTEDGPRKEGVSL